MKAHTRSTIAAISIALMAITPTLVHAESAMDACIKAFVEQRVPKDRSIKIRKLNVSSNSIGGVHSERIRLTATGAKSGSEIAAATCVISRDGDAVTLHESGKSTTLASS